jgi:uncharacterized membrane protein
MHLACNSINAVIQNPLFFASFIGPVIQLPLVAFLYTDANSMKFALLLASSALYIAGSFAPTMVGDLRLNQRVAKFDASKVSGNETAQARAAFEKPWNRLHAISPIASIGATCLS